MRRFKIFWDIEEEEKYLHMMALQGHILKKYSAFCRYHFEDGVEQNLNYKIDYRTFKNHYDFVDYITLFEDAGWKHVYGKEGNGNQYFLPIREDAGTEIFSDPASAAIRYKKLYEICITHITFAVGYLIMMITTGSWDWTNFGFLTPGLWERTGRAFWSGFFFELPLAMVRILTPFFFVALAIFYGYGATKLRQKYKEQMKA